MVRPMDLDPIDDTPPERLDLAGRRLVLGLSGGVACYKAAGQAEHEPAAGEVEPLGRRVVDRVEVHGPGHYLSLIHI